LKRNSTIFIYISRSVKKSTCGVYLESKMRGMFDSRYKPGPSEILTYHLVRSGFLGACGPAVGAF
jgi:hypothetical protein